MASVTFAADAELKDRLEKFPWVNWSEVARQELIRDGERKARVERMEELLKGSAFTEKDADELSEKVKASMHKRLVDKGLI